MVMPYNSNPMPSLVVSSSSFLLDEKLHICHIIATLEQRQSMMKKKRRVRFGSLEIHEHVVALGGDTVPSSGAPLGMSWERQAYYEIPVEDYEAFKTTPRKGREMLRSRTQRVDLLLDLGYSLTQIHRRSVECEEIRKQRRTSAKQEKSLFLQGLVQSVGKQLKRSFQPRRRSSLLGARAC
jgi:hypothetical protein